MSHNARKNSLEDDLNTSVNQTLQCSTVSISLKESTRLRMYPGYVGRQPPPRKFWAILLGYHTEDCDIPKNLLLLCLETYKHGSLIVKFIQALTEAIRQSFSQIEKCYLLYDRIELKTTTWYESEDPSRNLPWSLAQSRSIIARYRKLVGVELQLILDYCSRRTPTSLPGTQLTPQLYFNMLFRERTGALLWDLRVLVQDMMAFRIKYTGFNK